jgi:hypothetical protein
MRPICIGFRSTTSASKRWMRAREHRERAIIIASFFLLDRDHGHVQRTANHLDDLAQWHALFTNGIIDSVRRAFLQSEPVEAGDVQSMPRCPASAAVTDISGGAFLTCAFEQIRDQPALPAPPLSGAILA